MPAEETKPTPPAGRMLALLTSVSLWAAKAPRETLLGMHTEGLPKPEKSRHSFAVRNEHSSPSLDLALLKTPLLNLPLQ